MRNTPLEQRLLSVYQHAVRQRSWVVADHLLSAIESCAPHDGPVTETVADAYSALAATATTSGGRRPKAALLDP